MRKLWQFILDCLDALTDDEEAERERRRVEFERNRHRFNMWLHGQG